MVTALWRLAHGESCDLKKLQAREGQYRLRVGKWRIIFRVYWPKVSAYSRSNNKLIDFVKNRFWSPRGAGVLRGFSPLETFDTTFVRVGIPLLRIRSASARRFRESFEQRDVLGSMDEYSDVVWFSRLHYKPFGGTMPVRSNAKSKEAYNVRRDGINPDR